MEHVNSMENSYMLFNAEKPQATKKKKGTLRME